MFNVTTPPEKDYKDPWELPLQQRLRMLAQGRTRIAYFYERADNSTFRYRVYNMAHVLNAANDGVSASYFFLDDMHVLEEIADHATMLVICRTRYDHRVNHLVNAFRVRGKRVLYDIDDFVFDVDFVHLVVSTLALDVDDPKTWHDWFSYNSRLGATLKLCDAGITTTAPLAARMRQFAGIPVSVVPNFMNPEQLAMSDRVYGEKQSQAPGESGLIHVGYFSGSPSHAKDFKVVQPALEELLEGDERLGLVVVGYVEAGPRLAKFGERVTYLPFMDYVSLQRAIGTVEFNLMPLQVNAFTDCKSELKYFEAAAVGTVSIASPTQVYAEAIRHGENGFLAQAHRWVDVVREAVARNDYRDMAAHAREDALARYAWPGQYPAIIQALGL